MLVTPQPAIYSALRPATSAARRVLEFRAERVSGVATELLLTKAEQVSHGGACAAGLRLERQHRTSRYTRFWAKRSIGVP